MPEKDSVDRQLSEQLERTNKLIEQLQNQRYLQMVDRPWRFLWLSFLQGIAIALGSTLGLTAIITLAVYLTNRLEILAPLHSDLQTFGSLLQGYAPH